MNFLIRKTVDEAQKHLYQPVLGAGFACLFTGASAGSEGAAVRFTAVVVFLPGPVAAAETGPFLMDAFVFDRTSAAEGLAILGTLLDGADFTVNIMKKLALLVLRLPDMI